MRIAILTIGSRGDVQPVLALALGLRSAGHSVVLAADPFHQDLVESYGVEFAPLRGLADMDLARTWVTSSRTQSRYLKNMGAFLEPQSDAVLDDAIEACRGADGIVWTPLAFAGSTVAMHMGIPSVEVRLQPSTPTAAFPPFAARSARLGGLGNRISHFLYGAGFWQAVRPSVNRQRARLSLPPLGRNNAAPWRTGLPVLYAYSSQVLPVPQDWPPSHQVTGYWFLDQPHNWRPPEKLHAFLTSGEPPVGVAFGTMQWFDDGKLVRAAAAAAAAHGRRAVVIGAPDHIALPPELMRAPAVPHDWLFPHLAAVFHHGGAGTTSAAMRAGLPSVGVPFFGDQTFWSGRAHHLGVASAPVPRGQATAERLTAALGAVLDDRDVRLRAADLGTRLRSEDGVGVGVKAVQSALGRGASEPIEAL